QPENTTGTLATHLNNKHHSNISLKQQTFLCFTTKPYTAKDAQRVTEINKKLVDLIICCQLPFSIADNQYFKKLLGVLDSHYHGFCRQTLQNEIMNRFENACERITELLKNTNSMYLSDHEEDECYIAQSIIHKLEEYWNLINPSTILSTLLDSRSKLITFAMQDERTNAINKLRK
ncbi:34434_t:CDS:2, partial [Racocetra persica]